ncbi:exodeoxyribonuclease V subunit alpha [Lentisphaerota bacterium WC36G]|nr:exodeoxyribonuclease V subunit alpha [Lentisphaerae bacterium WC36]
MTEILKTIDKLKEYKLINYIDWSFVNFIADVLRENCTKEIMVVALLTSYSFNQHQNICLDLNLINTQEKFECFFDNIEHLIPEDQNKVKHILQQLYIDLNQTVSDLAKLENSDVVAIVKDSANLKKVPLKPLIFDGISKVYLQRYYVYELYLASSIAERVKLNNLKIAEFLDSPSGLRQKQIKGLLEDIYRIGTRFKKNKAINYQVLAIINAYFNNFAVITGGPGTGKTTVIATILALLLEKNSDLTVKIVAPSGKAQARVSESINEEIAFLSTSTEVLSALKNIEASTIHRLLGAVYNSAQFKHNKHNKISADVIIVDELSMVSSMLMAKLINAIDKNTKIILLGDRDQLSSVEAGALMANLYDVFKVNCYSKSFFDELIVSMPYLRMHQEQLCNSNKSRDIFYNIATKLQHSYRFSPDKGIGIVTKKINEAPAQFNAEHFSEILYEMHHDRTNKFHALNINDMNKHSDEEIEKYLKNFVKDLSFVDKKNGKKVMFSDYLQCQRVQEAYQLLNRFKILTADNVSRFGVHSINHIVEEVLNLPVGKSLYHGRVVIITENDYNLKLFNGDIGLFWRDKNSSQIGVFFPDSESPDKFIEISPGRLPQHETVFAMSVHRSQGSGFEKVLFLLLNKPNLSLINRELIYTAITRAKEDVHLIYNLETLKKGLFCQTKRSTGLAEHLTARLKG